jgi:hypothetical protein
MGIYGMILGLLACAILLLSYAMLKSISEDSEYDKDEKDTKQISHPGDRK